MGLEEAGPLPPGVYLHELFQASINTGRNTAPQLTWSLDSGQTGRKGGGGVPPEMGRLEQEALCVSSS